MKAEEAKRLNELLAEAELDTAMLKELASGNCRAIDSARAGMKTFSTAVVTLIMQFECAIAPG